MHRSVPVFGILRRYVQCKLIIICDFGFFKFIIVSPTKLTILKNKLTGFYAKNKLLTAYVELTLNWALRLQVFEESKALNIKRISTKYQ